ncbi:hypothetical protein LUZ60_011580 [Juncus effusus]|nr:hypothetical protein LUZ60_011580 [Juncus effusus]
MKPNLVVLPPSHYRLCRPVSLKPIRATNLSTAVSCINEATDGGRALTAREQRKLRQERRESRTDLNWREEVEDRLIQEQKNRKKKKLTRAQKLSVNTLTELGPQWWALRVTRTRSHETTALLSEYLKNDFPELQFKIYNPSIIETKKSKDGLLSVKRKPLIPGVMYIHFTMRRLIHDSIRSFEGVVGFMGTSIESGKDKYFIKPRPIGIEEIKETLKREKEEQEKADKALKDKELCAKKPSKRKAKVNKIDQPNLVPGVSVRVLSGPFADYTGYIKEIDLEKRKAIVEVLLFGRKSYVDVDIDQIDPVKA